MFAGASNILVTGGTFVQHGVAGIGGFDLLQRAVAHGAFHDSGERFDPPRCHPNTRTAVINKVMNWIWGLGDDDREAVIMWLNGAAGAGKSAIAQTIAELCHMLGLLLASFFFSRSDPSRSHSKSLIPTIAYQIAINLPATRARIAAAMERDPLLIERSLETQIVSLLVEPLRSFVAGGYFNSLPCRRLVVVDGLDECNNPAVQCNVLKAISHIFRDHHIPILFLVASRSESHLLQAFNSKPLVDLLVRVPLDINYRSADDIQLFLCDKFKEIRETHQLKAYIDSSWPSHYAMQTLVQKSSGQFIYAATVARYVSSVRHNPPERLEIILGIQPRQHSHDMPFAELDSLYRHIFSAVEDIDKVMQVIGLLLSDCLVTFADNAKNMESFLQLRPGEVNLLLADLSSIISIQNQGYIQILHASLGDFLCDPVRSGIFCRDMRVVSANLVHICIEHIKIAANSNVAYPNCRGWDRRSLLSEGSPFSYSVLKLFGLFRNAGQSRVLFDDILSLMQPRAIHLFHFWDDDLAFSLLNILLFSIETPESNPSFNHHLNLFDNFLIPIIRSYYESPHLMLLITFLHVNWEDDKYRRVWMDNAPYLSPSLKRYDNRGLMLASWYGRYSTEYRDDISIIGDYGNMILHFLEDPNRSGELVFNPDRFATAALCCLEYLCDCRAQIFPFSISRRHRRIRRSTPWKWRKTSIQASKRENDRLYRFWERDLNSFIQTSLALRYTKAGIRTIFYPLALNHLPFLLGRSGYSEKLTGFLLRGARFPVQALHLQYRGAMNRARAAITRYLSTFFRTSRV